MTSILTDPRSTEEERSECAGVIAQVTSPWVDSIHHVRGISDHVEDIIRELTGESNSKSRRLCRNLRTSWELFQIAGYVNGY